MLIWCLHQPPQKRRSCVCPCFSVIFGYMSALLETAERGHRRTPNPTVSLYRMAFAHVSILERGARVSTSRSGGRRPRHRREQRGRTDVGALQVSFVYSICHNVHIYIIFPIPTAFAVTAADDPVCIWRSTPIWSWLKKKIASTCLATSKKSASHERVSSRTWLVSIQRDRYLINS